MHKKTIQSSSFRDVRRFRTACAEEEKDEDEDDDDDAAAARPIACEDDE